MLFCDKLHFQRLNRLLQCRSLTPPPPAHATTFLCNFEVNLMYNFQSCSRGIKKALFNNEGIQLIVGI